jgi:hypothetical protein
MKNAKHLLTLIIGLFGFSVLGTSQNCILIGDTLVVNTSADEGPGSFREALLCANSIAGANTIVFNIPGAGPHVINTGSSSNTSLPILTDDETLIDARTQAGYQGVPVIILDGINGIWTNPINALYIQGDQCAVYGLEIRNFPDDGIDLRGADNCIVQENYIHDNGYEQDFFPGAPGTGPWNGCGIVIRLGSDNNQIQGNVIENNEYCGIIIRSAVANNNIGNLIPNTIRDNAAGILVGTTATSTQMRQNELICNDTIGIYLEAGANAGILPPVIVEANISTVSGTGVEGNIIEVFIADNTTCANAVCQGSIYLGSAIVEGGSWSLDSPFAGLAMLTAGDVVTATASNVQSNTSAYAECMVVTGVSNCTDDNGNIYVTNVNDFGAGSLRAAIECANETPGANTIRFTIPGEGPHTIFIGEDNDEPLPPLLDNGTILDATTQAGFGIGGDYSPQIRLDGGQTDWTGPYNAVWVRGDYCEVYGLEIVNFPDDGIDVTAADHVIIGAINKGNVLYSNGSEIDFWPDAPGTGPWNGCAIVLKAGSSYGVVEGNYLGTNVSESISAGNELCGIIIQNGGDHNRIAHNVIAYHEQGIRITNGGWYNSIRQNSLYCNDSIAIGLSGSANLFPATPVIDSASIIYISGRADSAAIVEVFIAADESCASGPCQGKVYLGTAITSDSVWVLQAPFDSGLELSDTNSVTVTATDLMGNTSTFSFCKAVDATIICDVDLSVENVQAASCGLNNGGFEIVLNNGTPPFTVDIGSGPSSQLVYNGLSAGTYSIEVSDANSCSAMTSIIIPSSTSVVIQLLEAVDANCNETNGSISVAALGGQAPYTFDIGGGPSSETVFQNLAAGSYTVSVSDALGCTDEITVVLQQSGTADISVLESLNATCGEANGAFLFQVSGGQAPYAFDIGDGPMDSPIFDNLSGGIYFITVTDAVGCMTNSIHFLQNDGEVPISEFSYLDNDETVSFSTASIGDGAHFWDFGDGNTSTLENPVHVYSASGDYNVCLEITNECGVDVSCEMISIVVPLSNVNVGGIIAKENGQPVALVEVRENNHSTQVTQSNGTYIYLDEAPQSDFDISPFKDINYNNGVTTFDLFQINQHILNIEALDSPYKIIAADINNSGVVTTFDLVNLRRVILLEVDTFLNNTSWRFVPADYIFADPGDPLSESFPESITLDNVIEDRLSEDFVAIKIGDVNLSSNPENIIISQEESQLIAEVEQETREEIILRIDLNQAERLSAFEGSLRFDPHRLRLVEILTGSHDAPVISQKNSLDLNFCWFAADGSPVDGYYFRIRLKKLGADWEKGLRLTDVIPGRSYDALGKVYPLQLRMPDTEIKRVQVSPNPFEERTRLTIFWDVMAGMPFQELKIFDLNGRIVYRQLLDLVKGRNELELDLSALAAGVYFYQLGDMKGKLIKQE